MLINGGNVAGCGRGRVIRRSGRMVNGGKKNRVAR